MNRKKGVLFFVWALIVFILDIFSLSTDDWVHDVTQTASGGLWKVCAAGTCISYNGKEAGYVKATQAFLIIACIMLFFEILICVLIVKGPDTGDGDKKSVSSGFSLAASFLGIAMTCFTTGFYAPSEDLVFGYSFILGWVAFGLSIIGVFVPG